MFRIGQEEIAELTRLIESRNMFKVNNGLRESYQVEDKLRRIWGVPHAIFMTSGHAALTSALIGLGVGPGDQVIVPAYTYIATAMAVVAVGAIPVIAECDQTLTIDPADVRAKITKATKAIIPVHIQGFPCDMDAILALAKEFGLGVIEDACQADGGTYKGARLGSLGNAGALSFNYYKLVSAGEGGALLTKEKLLFERALIYQDSSAVAYFGDQMPDFSTQTFCGQEFRSNELCAAVMNCQLDRMDGILADLRRNKRYLTDGLKGLAEFAPSHDSEGDCALVLAFRFPTEEKARAFAKAEGIHGTVPVDVGKHVYKDWAPILEKRGAFHPLMDPFRMPANQGIIPDYHVDMCPKTLDLLSRTVYIPIDPDDQTQALEQKLDLYKKALMSI